MSGIFTPHELKTIEVDVEKKIFRVNGEDFGEGCTEFSISCSAERNTDEFLNVNMRIESDVHFSTYNEKGEKTTDHTYKVHGQ